MPIFTGTDVDINYEINSSMRYIKPQFIPNLLTNKTSVNAQKRRTMRPIKPPLFVQNAYLMQLNKIVQKMRKANFNDYM